MPETTTDPLAGIDERWPDYEPPDKKAEIEIVLLGNIRSRLPELKDLLDMFSGHREYEDPIYRFYHQSYKVYNLQATTEEIVAKLKSLLPERKLNEWFDLIVKEGTGKTFEERHNSCWPETTRPMLEAFFHARFMLQMVCKYGPELMEPPSVIPSGWGAVLWLYRLR